MIGRSFVASFVASFVVSELRMALNHENLKVYQRMLVGLRKSWAHSGRVVREDSAEYSVTGEGFDKARDKE